MKIDLTGKTALVTGSTSGIGHATALGLADSGANVVVNGRTQPKVDPAVPAISRAAPGSKVAGVAADVSTAAGCKTLVETLPDVDILINNAGIFEPKGFFEIPDEDWSRFFEVNVMSGVRLSRAYLPRMLKAQLGPHRLHLLRIRAEHPEGDDPLWHNKNRAARGLAWPCRDDTRHRGDRQFGAAGADDVGGRRDICKGARKTERAIGRGGGVGIRQTVSPDFAVAAFCNRRGDRQHGGLCRLERGIGHQRRGASRRGRHRPDHCVSWQRLRVGKAEACPPSWPIEEWWARR